MKALLCCLILLISLDVAGTSVSAISAVDKIYVELFQAHPPASTIFLEGPMEIEGTIRQQLPKGLYQVATNGQSIVLSSLRASAQQWSSPFFLVKGLNGQGLGIAYSTRLKRHYRGTVRIAIQNNEKLRLVNEVSRQDYVTSVVGSETSPGWPLEALKCQAVLTQTRLTRYKPNNLLGDSTQVEVYLGAQHERPEVKVAVNSVWGNILTYNDCPIAPFYHAVCGGTTSNGAHLFGKPKGSLPYLASVACKYCSKSPFGKAKLSVIPWSTFKRVCGAGLPEIVIRDAAGRPLTVRLPNNQIVSGYGFWISLGKKLGWDKAPGTRYNLRTREDGDVVIESVGAGHGVGLCQWGAAEQARQGKSYRAILEYYFPGTKLRQSKIVPNFFLD